MRRKNLRSRAMRGLILGLWCATAGFGVAATPPATLQSVDVNKPAAGDELILRIEGDFSFKAFQASQDTILIDLMGVEAGKVASQAEWKDGLLKGYSLLQYTNAAHMPVAHLRLSLAHASPFHAEQTAQGLRVAFGEESAPVIASPATPSAGTEAATGTSSAEIQKISVTGDAEGQTVVDVATTGRAEYHAFRLPNPERLVVDFEGAHRVPRERVYHAQSAVLRSVRVGQFRAKDPSVVRVVADLVGHPAYEVQREADGVRIVLSSRTTKTEPPSSPVTTEAPAEKAAHPLPAATQSPETRAMDNALPGNPSSVSAAPRVEAVNEPAEHSSAQKAAQIIAASTPQVSESLGQAPAGTAEGGSEGPKYTGEPISLNLKDVDLKDFFRLIHEISGLNIIIDPNVTGSVTMVLDNVPWDQALDIVLKNNQLGKTLEGNVLRIAKLSTLTAEQANAAKLAEAQQEAQPLVTKFVPVNYAKASQIATMLKSWVGGGALSKRGNILVDDRTNTLIVSDIASQIPVILPIIAKLDTKTKQVAIEARIERVTRDFQRTLANALSIGGHNISGSTTQAGLTGVNSGAAVSPVVPFTKVPNPPLSSTQGTGFGVYAISNVGARYIINDVLTAAESVDNAKTISKPTIVTQDNVPGKVLQGTQIPIQTTINNTISITYVQASLQLTVTPQVTSDGNIFLIIDVNNSTPGAALTSAGPSINTQQATTQVLVPDGGTVIFGGVTVNQVTSSQQYVPLLGKIPVLGNLFKSSVKTQNDQELLFFVSPKVLPG
jgi:type IV pilus secretin PilQ/predicted competence protein